MHEGLFINPAGLKRIVLVLMFAIDGLLVSAIAVGQTTADPARFVSVPKWYGKFSIRLAGYHTTTSGTFTEVETYNDLAEGSFEFGLASITISASVNGIETKTDTCPSTQSTFMHVTSTTSQEQITINPPTNIDKGLLSFYPGPPKYFLRIWLTPNATRTITYCNNSKSQPSPTQLFLIAETTQDLPAEGILLSGTVRLPWKSDRPNVYVDFAWSMSPTEPVPDPPPLPPPPPAPPVIPPPIAAVDDTVSNPCIQNGSVIACENQSLGEVVDVVGTPFTLHYQSDRVPGRAAANALPMDHARQLGGWTLSAHHVYDATKKTVYLGTGDRRSAGELGEVLPGPNGTLIRSVDMGATYEFDNSGRHLSTRDVKTGTKVRTFGYVQDRLATVTDANSQVTTIERDSAGNPTAIVNPLGVRTTFTLDANGYLSSITNPAQEKVTLSMTPGGLLVGMTDPKGHAHVYTYDPAGRLVKDELEVGSQSLVRVTQLDGSYTVTHTSAENRTTTYSVTPQTGSRTVTAPGGYMTKLEPKSDGSQTVRLPDGTQIDTMVTPDPSMDMTQTVTTPAGLKKAMSYTRRFPPPPSAGRISETFANNGSKVVREYVNQEKSLKESINGNYPRRVFVFDEKGRVTTEEMRGLAPIYYQYDERGQLASVQQGAPVAGVPGSNQPGPGNVPMRRLEFQYDKAGLISQLKDPIGRTINIQRDGAGRVLAAQSASGQQIFNVKRDANGNVTMVGSPAHEEHVIQYQLPHLPSAYTAPMGSPPKQWPPTRFEYNNDLQLRRVLQPDGRMLEWTYDSAGRVADLNADRLRIGFRYNATTGKLDNINTNGGTGLSYQYDGPLLKSETWTKSQVQGTVQREYDAHFRLKSLHIVPPVPQPPAHRMPANPPTALQPRSTPLIPADPLHQPVVFSYDAEGYLKDAGGFGLKRDTWNGQLQNTVLGDGKAEYWHRDRNLKYGTNSVWDCNDNYRGSCSVVRGDNPLDCEQTSYWCGHVEVTSKAPYSVPNHFVHDERGYNQYGEVTSYEAKYRHGEVTSDEAKFSKDVLVSCL